MKDSLLLQPLKVGNLTLKNRIMFPPLTTGYEERDGSIGSRSLNFYKRLAKGGVGYIVIGDVAPVNTASPTPKLCDDKQIPSFRALADAVHEYGSKVAVQIFHPEYDVPGVGKLIIESQQAAMAAMKAKEAGNTEEFSEKMALSKKISDDAYAKLHHDMLHFVSESTYEQLSQIKDSIVACAVRAEKAGIDAVEIHGDRLLGSLCSTILNHRTDIYGGSFENRIRFALEVVSALKEAVPDMILEYKLPIVTVNKDGSLRGKGGLVEEEALKFAVELEKAGVDMIQVAQADHTGNMGDTIPPMGSMPYNWTLPIAEKVKHLVSIPVATVGRVITVERGEKILADGKADIIGYGRSLLTDPDIACKTETGEPIRTCLNCNRGCVEAIQNRRYISCILNAENGDEETIFIKPGEGRKKIAVVGAGIAGLEAARVSAKRGYEVDVYDTADKIGGQVNLAAVPPRKSEIMRSVEYYEKILPSLGVNIHLETECTKDVMDSADAVICAVGAHNITLHVPGADNSNVVSSWDLLAGKAEVSGMCAVIGGGLVGTETAEYLAEKGCQVSVIEMLDKIASGEVGTVLPLVEDEFARYGVKQYVNTRVDSIAEDGKCVHATDTKDGRQIDIPCDYVIMAAGSGKNSFDETQTVTPVYYVGDCSGEKTADIAAAIRSAYITANEI